jgi:hypothetical protein
LIFKGKVIGNGSTKLCDLGIEPGCKFFSFAEKRYLLQRKGMVTLQKK